VEGNELMGPGDGAWVGVGPAFHGDLSGDEPSPFPDPTHPEQPPFKVMPPPPHMSVEVWQSSYYDATTNAPMGAYTQRPAGPCSLETGRLTTGDWPESRIWKQV
jgi:hypothetical protein